jgi:radical SAM protein with 4Fe4S-binding SPASM domain
MFPKLKGCALKKAEGLFIYDFIRDELYEVDEEAFDFLKYCTGKNKLEEIPNSDEGKEVLKFALSEGLVEDDFDANAPEQYSVKNNPAPSLRYLQLHITERCNLNCKHCYLGSKGMRSLNFETATKAIREFGEIGWKLLVTGGEPLLYERFWDILSYASKFPIRVEVLSNGTLITDEIAERMSKHVHSIQISLDGMKEGHEALRGLGSFEKTISGIKAAKKYISVSIATMIHAKNINEFDDLKELVEDLEAAEWMLDVPSLKGNLLENRGLIPKKSDAVRIYKNYGYGGGSHSGDEDFSCGSHLCSIDVDGNVTKCGFFSSSVGKIGTKPLLKCWHEIVEKYLPKLNSLECKNCEYLYECRGGCRYRAALDKNFTAKDLFMCDIYLNK